MGWRRFMRRAWWDDERTRELESYLDLETDDNIARGMSPDQARAAARRKLGNTGRIREEIYAMNTITLLEWLAQDIRYAARVLRRSPGFTIAAVLTLALGIGGVTVIYSALRNILLDPFPYVKSDRMVNVFLMTPRRATATTAARWDRTSRSTCSSSRRCSRRSSSAPPTTRSCAPPPAPTSSRSPR